MRQCARRHGEAQPSTGMTHDTLFVELYSELKQLADAHARRFEGQITLSATALVHEAYLQFADGGARRFESRAHFLAYASRAIRGILIDYARNRHALKRGGDFHFTSLGEADAAAAPDSNGVDLAALGDALEELSALDPRLGEVVDLHFFCGFSFAEIAMQRGVSERTVLRDWKKARLLLGQSMEAADDPA